jgi:hypothetical protein
MPQCHKKLPKREGWANIRVGFGAVSYKFPQCRVMVADCSQDRCAYVPKAQAQAVRNAQMQAQAAVRAHYQQAVQSLPGSPLAGFSPMTPFSPFPAVFGTPSSSFGSPIFGNTGFTPGPPHPTDKTSCGNRNIYLGNLSPETTTNELFNNIRHGKIVQIKHNREKLIAVSLGDSLAAHATDFSSL